MFTEGGDSDSGEEDLMATPLTKSGYSQLQLEEEESRDRSQSTGSEQIGRFEARNSLLLPSLPLSLSLSLSLSLTQSLSPSTINPSQIVVLSLRNCGCVC